MKLEELSTSRASGRVSGSQSSMTMRERQALVEEQIRSGLSVVRWCKQKGMSDSTLSRWKEKFRKGIWEWDENLDASEAAADAGAPVDPAPGVASPISFVNVTDLVSAAEKEPAQADRSVGTAEPEHSQTELITAMSRIEISFGGFSVSVPEDFNEKTLQKVLEVISHV